VTVFLVSVLGALNQELTMLKIMAAGATALFVVASSLVYAQAPSPGVTGAAQSNVPNWDTLTDARINIVKAVLQLTPDQEKYWPAIEDAIRTRAKDREARLGAAAARLRELRAGGLGDRDPIGFLHRRAAALTQRAADLNKLADAWQPLYQSLTPDQKQRMAFLTVFVIREMRSAAGHRMHSDDEDESD
jgi:LTXXQ motif family protein